MTKAAKLARILQVPLWRRELKRHRVAASVEHEAVLRLLGALDLIVDIGANRGQYSLLSRHCNPAARITAFEPLPSPAATFRSVFADDQRVTLFQSAIGPEQGNVPIHISARDDSSSLLPISALQAQTFSGTAEVGTTSVTVAPLSNFLAADDIVSRSLLKIDVQGYEYNALRGCESLLNLFAYIFCECSFVELYSGQQLAPAVIAWLASRGFLIKGMYNAYYNSDGLAIQADFLFERQPEAN
jgi:FkbM family methyltransferase